MRPVVRHPWELTPREAVALQRDLAGRVDGRGRIDLRRVRLVLGADVSYSQRADACHGAVVLWDVRRGAAVAEAVAARPSAFPYVPGLLSFREIPVLVDALAKLPVDPEVILAEGHGLAHPRRFGLASHLGVIYDRPAVGCAKTVLVGDHREPGEGRGGHAVLRHRGEVVGEAVRTRAGVKPVFASVGHAVTLAQARRLVLRLCTRYRLPEPLRRAHALANAHRREAEG